MKESLGLSISNNIIRYAKIRGNSKELRIEKIGLKFYNGNPKIAINEIIEETNSEKAIINTNTIDENYYYSTPIIENNDKIINRKIDTEFENFCISRKFSKDLTIGKNLFHNEFNKILGMHIYDSKNNLINIYRIFEPNQIKSIYPIATIIKNLTKINENENVIIVNLEEHITITTIVNQQIHTILKMNFAMLEVLKEIRSEQESFINTYNSLKQTTIFVKETKKNDKENSKKLTKVIPLLYNIAERITKIKTHYGRIAKIYLTGFGANIQNIELYFGQLFSDVKIELLKPYFISPQINTKEYVEYNSAISLAFQEFKGQIEELNFASKEIKSDFKNIVKQNDLQKKDNKKEITQQNRYIKKYKINIIIDLLTIIIILLIYISGNQLLQNKLNYKKAQVEEISKYILEQNKKAKLDEVALDNKSSEYLGAKINSEITEEKASNKQLNSLLNQLSYNLPKEVKLIEIKGKSIENENGKHISIIVKSNKSEDILKFKKTLEDKKALDNIKSTEEKQQDGMIQAVIEGDLK